MIEALKKLLLFQKIDDYSRIPYIIIGILAWLEIICFIIGFYKWVV